MRFRPSRTPPPYLNRRDQMRMLSMVLVLCFLVVAIRFAARPSSWYWLTGPPEQGQQAGRPLTEKDVDWDVRLDGKRSLRPGEVIIEEQIGDEALNRESASSKSSQAGENAKIPSPPRLSRGSYAKVIEPEEAVDPVEKASDGEMSQPASGPDPIASDPRVEIDADLLTGVEDNTIGVRHDESDIYFSILAKARDIPQSYLDRAARNDVAFLVLMAESDRYRGQLLTIDGRLKRLLKFPASPNAHGIETLYEAWIFTPDSGKNPYLVVCTDIPEGIPQGEDITDSVRVRATGYFFKRYGYAAQHGLHIAPLLLGKRLRWFPPRTVEAQDDGLIRYLVGIIAFVGGAIAITLWRFSVSDARFQQSHLKRLTEAPREAIDALSNVEQTDMQQMFAHIAKEVDGTGASAGVGSPADDTGLDEPRAADVTDDEPADADNNTPQRL